MGVLKQIIYNISTAYDNPVLLTTIILSVLTMVFLLGLYEFAVYRLVSHRAFYNRSFNICVAVLPFFISTIVLCLQSNMVITLGTIGALAILRFRTAVKDPVDMLYLLWSVHTGIVCGCQLYEVAILTSLTVTIVLLGMEYIPLGKQPQILIIHCMSNAETSFLDCIAGHTKRYRVKSRNYTSRGLDLVIELCIKNPGALSRELQDLGADKFSFIEYNNDNIL